MKKKKKRCKQVKFLASYTRITKKKKRELILFRLDPEAGCLIRFTLCSLTVIAASAKEEAACPGV